MQLVLKIFASNVLIRYTEENRGILERDNSQK